LARRSWTWRIAEAAALGLAEIEPLRVADRDGGGAGDLESGDLQVRRHRLNRPWRWRLAEREPGRLAERGGSGDLGPVQLVEARPARALAVKPLVERGGGDIEGIWLPGRSGSRSLLGEVPR
jgi:hypothetical protein